MKIDVKEFEKSMIDKHIIFAFSGAITYTLLSTVSITIKEELTSHTNSSVLANTYEIFIEMLQNIMNYSKRNHFDDNEKNVGTSFIQYIDNTFRVIAGNRIFTKDAIFLKEKIDYINAMDKDELKKAYRQARREGADVHSQGAGLGFLTIGRKTSSKIDYEITKIDEEHSYFQLIAEVKDKK